MRGWTARTLGPGFAPLNTSFVIPNQSGDMKLEFDAEYRFKLFWKLRGALFMEAGNVWWGLGIRLDLNFILVRLDFGMRVHDPSRPEGQRWVDPSDWLESPNNAIHFGVGYPF